MEEYKNLIAILFFLIYTSIIMLLTYLLTHKKSISEKIQVSEVSIKELSPTKKPSEKTLVNNISEKKPAPKESHTKKNQKDDGSKIDSKKGLLPTMPWEDLTKKDFKKDRLPIFQDRINRTLIPQLKNKVIERSESSEFSNREDFFRIWLEGSEKQFSTARILTSNLESDKIFDGKSFHIRNKFEKADKNLFRKADALYKELKIYDALMTHLLEKIADTYQKKYVKGVWENISELHFYKLFNVEDIKRRKGHKANMKFLSKGKILKSELEKQKKGIEKKAYELILECYSIIYWEKEIPYDVKSKIRRITDELNKRSYYKIDLKNIYKKYQLKD